MLRDHLWKTVYRTGKDDLLNDFYKPALSEAVYYDRAVGFFSSALLVSAAKGLGTLVRSGGRMRLIVGDSLDSDEYEAIKDGYNQSWLMESLTARLLDLLKADQDDLRGKRLQLLGWMVACGRLEIRFAYRRRGMYHEKIGIVRDANGDKIIFQGSANETPSAMDIDINAESFSVYPSWSDAYNDYGRHYEEEFISVWEGVGQGTVTIELPSEIYEIIADRFKNIDPMSFGIEGDLEEQELLLSRLAKVNSEPSIPRVLNGNTFEVKDHQRQALEAWRANAFRGILKLATGSGKTITAIYGAIRIYESAHSLCVIVAVPYVDLAKQWIDNLRLFNIEAIPCFEVKSGWHDSLKAKVDIFSTGQIRFLPIVVVNKTLSSVAFQDILAQLPMDRTMMIGDECHRHGSEKLNKLLPPSKYRLGLSATPFQDDDDELESPFPDDAKERLINYYGEIVKEYSLSDAINDDVLAPYKYFVYPVYLTEAEQEEYEELTKKIANVLAASGAGNRPDRSESLTALCGRRSRLLGEAEEKFIQLKSVISSLGESSKGHCLFYCPEGSSEVDGSEGRNVDRVSQVLSSLGWRTSQFTSFERRKSVRKDILRAFHEGGIDALVSMKVLDEGIDIPACRAAFILASTRNPRQYVQRRGRILRKSKGKTFAEIHDFIVLPARGHSNSPLGKKLVQAEMERVSDFQLLALNKIEVYDSLKDMGLA